MRTDPYPWPWDHTHGDPLTPDRISLVVCGWQRHWLTAVGDGPATVETIRSTVAGFRSAGVTVTWVRCGAPAPSGRRPPVLPVVGSAGWSLLDGPEPGDLIIDTPGLDAFLVEWTDLELRNRGIDRLVMCGLGTEGPVSSSTRTANDRGYECLTATDAVVHYTPRTGAASLSSVCMSGGIFGAVGPAADVLAALATPPGSPGSHLRLAPSLVPSNSAASHSTASHSTASLTTPE